MLYELIPVEGSEPPVTPPEFQERDAAAALVIRSPQSGRFYHRASPGSPPLVSPGDPIKAGTAVGLIEVMKTFTHVTYSPGGPLPERARVLEFLVDDGADVELGDPLIILETL